MQVPPRGFELKKCKWIKSLHFISLAHYLPYTPLDRSPAFLTFDDFIRSNEIVRTK